MTRDETAAYNMTNPKVVIFGGNQVVAAWYGSGVNEIMVQTGEIETAPSVSPIPWEQSVVVQTPTAVMGEIIPTTTPIPLPISSDFTLEESELSSAGVIMFVSLVPAILIVLVLVFIQFIRLRKNI